MVVNELASAPTMTRRKAAGSAANAAPSASSRSGPAKIIATSATTAMNAVTSRAIRIASWAEALMSVERTP